MLKHDQPTDPGKLGWHRMEVVNNFATLDLTVRQNVSGPMAADDRDDVAFTYCC